MDGSSIFHGTIIKAPHCTHLRPKKFSPEGMEVIISTHNFVGSPVLVVRGPAA